MKIGRNPKGFTLFELLVVIAILAITALIAIPNFIGWRSKAKLRGAADNLKGELQGAKASAARESSWVVIEFFQGSYRIFVDNGAGGGNRNNRILDGSERILRQRDLPAGVQIESSPETTFFNPRGRTGAAGTIVLLNNAGARLNLIIGPMGTIRIEEG